ncbi:FecCD family ABC transporter permease [Syntrophotalea acetylenica]|jgi:iron complex transport system permease protein|uniref:ABC transporter permease n=3 Tax=Syntrophotalea TaxID=2812025 RepID=A0A1L3GFY4_SYNAC|nr:iron ABC transporter permease [Syntrophotalea acetylenica]APG24827.1 ABC transporter permease [Syntrophotalea acetylenica]APG42887.1 ABC transporter permease [Syntrophotalea acetylenica]MDY0261362.1 iron ABC transporter permease [Syntrophotalea acetylenica]
MDKAAIADRPVSPSLNRLWLPGALCLLLLGLVTVSLSLGKYPVSVYEILLFFRQQVTGAAALGPERYDLLRNILWEIRAPRIAAAVLIGAALSTSGAAFQSMFINPLVSPGLLGVLPGASFGAALGMLLSRGWFGVQFCCFAGGLLAVGIAIGIARLYRGDRLLMLILGGIISGSLFTSLLSIVKYLADPYDTLPAIVYWLMGGLSMTDSHTVLWISIPVLSGIAGLLLMARYLNVLSMGDEEARSLGVNVSLIRFWLIFFATVISALTVVVGGLIGWVGLIIPHIGRMLVGPDNRTLLPVSALLGALYLVLVDDVSRLLLDIEIPLGIITALIGIPFFILVLKNARKGWG